MKNDQVTISIGLDWFYYGKRPSKSIKKRPPLDEECYTLHAYFGLSKTESIGD